MALSQRLRVLSPGYQLLPNTGSGAKSTPPAGGTWQTDGYLCLETNGVAAGRLFFCRCHESGGI